MDEMGTRVMIPDAYDGPTVAKGIKDGNIPASSYALADQDKGHRTNIGNTKYIMALLSEMWLFNLFFILGGTFLMTFYLPQFYIDYEMWNTGCYWKLGGSLDLYTVGYLLISKKPGSSHCHTRSFVSLVSFCPSALQSSSTIPLFPNDAATTCTFSPSQRVIIGRYVFSKI